MPESGIACEAQAPSRPGARARRRPHHDHPRASSDCPISLHPRRQRERLDRPIKVPNFFSSANALGLDRRTERDDHGEASDSERSRRSQGPVAHARERRSPSAVPPAFRASARRCAATDGTNERSCSAFTNGDACRRQKAAGRSSAGGSPGWMSCPSDIQRALHPMPNSRSPREEAWSRRRVYLSR